MSVTTDDSTAPASEQPFSAGVARLYASGGARGIRSGDRHRVRTMCRECAVQV